jgi:hypothetical protein
MTKCRDRITIISETNRVYSKGEWRSEHPTKCKILQNYGQEYDACWFPDSDLRNCPIAVDKRRIARAEKQLVSIKSSAMD